MPYNLKTLLHTHAILTSTSDNNKLPSTCNIKIILIATHHYTHAVFSVARNSLLLFFNFLILKYPPLEKVEIFLKIKVISFSMYFHLFRMQLKHKSFCVIHVFEMWKYFSKNIKRLHIWCLHYNFRECFVSFT